MTLSSSRTTRQSTRFGQWLRQHGITLLDWPPKSPNANPIENLWHEIKTAANHRQLRNAAELWNALQETWQQIPAARVRNLAESVPRRLDTIRRTRGGNIWYRGTDEGLQFSFMLLKTACLKATKQNQRESNLQRLRSHDIIHF